ncbi:24302_t:CDS:2 [Cetraspora pellucida]|uniref:24302_t:CDS:1 n=1 Tax=Cetraspora pellucida TaxID=1433469 RepID=A0A9N9B112_9GLOM|nr:24302_t:CDS:2 [Cetraspora pellucida]
MVYSYQPLTISSYISLVFFLLAIAFVVFPLSIEIPYSDRLPVIPIIHPKHGQKIKIRINLATSPLIAIVILLATKSIEFQVVVNGFLGDQGIQPYSIMILFFALAYICISLDVTGFVEFCAYGFSNRSGNDGRKLFTYFYILFNLMSAFTSNDVVVLTGTSNPTNVIVAQAYGITFLTYSAWMILPTIVSMILAYFALYTMFRRSGLIPNEVHTQRRNPKDALKDKKGAIFGVIVLGCCLITLMGTSFTSLSVWIVTLPFAAIMLVRDIWYDLSKKDIVEIRIIEESEKNNVISEKSMDSEKKIGEANENNESKVSLSSDKKKDANLKGKDVESERVIEIKDNSLDGNTGLEKDITNEDTSLNILNIPFVSRRKRSSDIEHSNITPRSVSPSSLTIQKKKSHSTKGSFDSNIVRPEIELPSIYKEHENFAQAPHVTPAIRQGCIYALIIGSNIGACLTIVGALAGLMWDKILKDKGEKIGYWQFVRWNLGVLPIIAVGACGVLIMELWIYYDKWNMND